jgi:hypothetical protein
MLPRASCRPALVLLPSSPSRLSAVRQAETSWRRDIAARGRLGDGLDEPRCRMVHRGRADASVTLTIKARTQSRWLFHSGRNRRSP